MQNTLLRSLSDKWRTFRWKTPTLLTLINVIGILTILIIASQQKTEDASDNEQIANVEVKKISELASNASIEKTAILKPATHASLIARSGGRITNIISSIGAEVTAGQRIAEVDGTGEANPTRVQLQNANRNLNLFDAIQTQSLTSAQNAAGIAQQNLDAAEAGREISADIQAKNRNAAANSLEKARVGIEQAENANEAFATTDKDILVKSANLGFESAKLAQDQATLSERLNNRQTGDALQQSRKGLETAQINQKRITAEFASQRAALIAQRDSASEQLKFAQITTPVKGTITRLSIRDGDYVQPGQVVGEVTSDKGGALTVHVPTIVKNNIEVGKNIQVQADENTYSAVIAGIGGAPSASSSLWQVDLAIDEKIAPNDINEMASVIFSFNGNEKDKKQDTILIPLDAINIRQNGVVLFTVDDQNIVHEHVIEVINYQSDTVEARIDIPQDARVIVRGNRTLQDNEKVIVR